MPTTLEQSAQIRATRPLYLKKVPTPIWEQIHVNAIRSGMRLTDYLLLVLAAAEPITTGPRSQYQSVAQPSELS